MLRYCAITLMPRLLMFAMLFSMAILIHCFADYCCFASLMPYALLLLPFFFAAMRHYDTSDVTPYAMMSLLY